MSNYLVTWEVDAANVSSPRAAAGFARDIQLREDSLATVFTVSELGTGESVQVDLGEEENWED